MSDSKSKNQELETKLTNKEKRLLAKASKSKPSKALKAPKEEPKEFVAPVASENPGVPGALEEPGAPGAIESSSPTNKRKACELEESLVTSKQESKTEPIRLTNKQKRQLAVATKLASKTSLSHKEARKQKKLSLNTRSAQTEPEGGETETAEPDGAVGETGAMGVHRSRCKVERTGYSIWIGNLSFSTPSSKLVEFFESRGIKGISRVNMPTGVKKYEQNRGFAYLDLSDEPSLTSALKLSETNLDGRKLLIKKSDDFAGRPSINPFVAGLAKSVLSGTPGTGIAVHPQTEGGGRGTGLTRTAQKILRSQKNPPSMSLFLGNLAFSTTEEGVRGLFEDSATRRAILIKHSKIDSKKQSKRVPNPSSDSDSDSGSSSDTDSDSDTSKHSKHSKHEKDSKHSKDAKDGGDSKDPKLDKEGLDRASTAGIRKIRLATFEDAPTKCKGFGFVDFHTSAFATATLLDLRNYSLDGRKITIEYASPDATRRGASAAQKHLFPSPSGHSHSGDRGANAVGCGFKRRRVEPESFESPESGGQRNPARAYGANDANGANFSEQRNSAPAPTPGSFDPNALIKRHKETQEERMARRANSVKRQRPGAALANAPRANLSILPSTGKKISFDD